MEYNKQVLSMFPKEETKKKEEVKKEKKNKQDLIEIFDGKIKDFFEFCGFKEVKGTRAMKTLAVKSGEKRDYLSCKVARKIEEGIEVRTAVLTFKHGFPSITSTWADEKTGKEMPLDREIVKPN